FAGHRFALELRYLRELRGGAIAQHSIDEMRRAGDFSEQQAQHWLQALADVLPDVRPGDRIMGVHAPGQGASFVVNGKPAVTIADPVFATLFFAIWLGPATSQPGLRAALLGAAR
ncbi:MAG: chalcone isomerase family protein, partial [Ramlibacter sp.]